MDHRLSPRSPTFFHARLREADVELQGITLNFSHDGVCVEVHGEAPPEYAVVNLAIGERHGDGGVTEHEFKSLVIHSDGTRVGLLLFDANVSAWCFLRERCLRPEGMSWERELTAEPIYRAQVH